MTDYVAQLMERYPCLTECEKEIRGLVSLICNMYKKSGKLLLCGNGGSAADCEHISGELMKSFLSERKVCEKELDLPAEISSELQKGISAIPLVSFMSSVSAFSNDSKSEMAFAQLVFVLGRKEDIFWGISTSGNSENIVIAALTAKAMGMKTVVLTGRDGGRLADICDVTIRVPENETYKIQELHLPVYHTVCAECERRCFE